MFLRGHALADGRPSPEMDFTNLSMDWVELRHHLGNKIRNVVDWEILQVIRSTAIPGGSSCKCASPTMRKQPGRVCRGQPIRVRAYQGHNAFVLKKGKFAPI